MKKHVRCPDCGSKASKKSGRDWVRTDNGTRVYVQKLQCLKCGRNYREFTVK